MLGVENSETSAADITFQAASDVSACSVFGSSFLHLGAGLRVVGHFADSDEV